MARVKRSAKNSSNRRNRRERVVGIRAHQDELERWQRKAEELGHKRSTWVRYIANQASMP